MASVALRFAKRIGAVAALCSAILSGAAAYAQQQIDIPGPPGSAQFGTTVKFLANGDVLASSSNAVYLYSSSGALIAPLTGGNEFTPLPNGNIVVSGSGSVYLYNSTGGLISTLSGNSVNDKVGSGGITVLTNGNFVVASPYWNSNRGAVTWIDGNAGLSATISAANSLVGSQPGDSAGFCGTVNSSGVLVGDCGVTALSNGNYLVLSSYWANGAISDAGAITWGNGTTGTTGAVSAANSLVGDVAGDAVGSGGATILSNGNAVVASPNWGDGTFKGAVTWVNGGAPSAAIISAGNSLVGDAYGNISVTALSNGNYVVGKQYWGGNLGAVTWGNGSGGISGPTAATNSLVGSVGGTNGAGDRVGGGIVPLPNGNYVVSSYLWNNETGATTWANGSVGLIGTVSASNSLVGSQAGDWPSVTVLSNSNYVVSVSTWSNGSTARVGAVVWGNGATGVAGQITTGNSLYGTSPNDVIGSNGVLALGNGNYVVLSPCWNAFRGAATWGNGSTGTVGAVAAANSLSGAAPNDAVGGDNVYEVLNHTYSCLHPYVQGASALANGNYVVSSWNLGERTWIDGDGPASGAVSAGNSFSTQGNIVPLPNGNYVISDSNWNNATGAVSWQSGFSPAIGSISASNSLIGTAPNQMIGQSDYPTYGSVVAMPDSNYVVYSPNWSQGTLTSSGAVSLGVDGGGTVGPISTENSVLGGVANGGRSMVYDYDVTHALLVVGQPAANQITLFTRDPIFANGFE